MLFCSGVLHMKLLHVLSTELPFQRFSVHINYSTPASLTKLLAPDTRLFWIPRRWKQVVQRPLRVDFKHHRRKKEFSFCLLHVPASKFSKWSFGKKKKTIARVKPFKSPGEASKGNFLRKTWKNLCFERVKEKKMLFCVTKQIIRGVRKVRKLTTERILLKYTETEHK